MRSQLCRESATALKPALEACPGATAKIFAKLTTSVEEIRINDLAKSGLADHDCDIKKHNRLIWLKYPHILFTMSNRRVVCFVAKKSLIHYKRAAELFLIDAYQFANHF